MFKKIKMLFRIARKDRPTTEDVRKQLEYAERLRDMLGVARKLDMTVVLIVRVGNQEQGVAFSGMGPETGWLYDFACGAVMATTAELSTDAKFGTDWKDSGFVHPDGRIEI